MVRRGRRFESVRGLHEVPADHLFLLAKWDATPGLGTLVALDEGAGGARCSLRPGEKRDELILRHVTLSRSSARASFYANSERIISGPLPPSDTFGNAARRSRISHWEPSQ